MINSAFSFIAGIAAFKFFPFFPFLIVAISILASVLLFVMHREHKERIFLITLIFISGFSYSFIRDEKPPEIKFPEREILLEGRVIDVPEEADGKVRFIIDNVSVEKKPVSGRIKLSALSARFYNTASQEYLFPAYGDRLRMLAKVSMPKGFRNPGVYPHDFKKDGVIGVGYVKQIQKVGNSTGLLVGIYGERQMLGRIMDRSLSPESASFHKAIIPGFQRGITQEMRDAFSATGLAHILSISGTHFALLAFIFFTAIKTITKFLPVKILTKVTLHVTPTQIAVVLTMPVLLLYAVISGASTPAIRSLIMVSIYMLALFLGRRGQWLNSLSIAAVIILLWQPDALFDLSFQLSFIAVLSIGYVLKEKAEEENWPAENRAPDSRYMQLFKRAFIGIRSSLLITVAAVIGTAPFVIYYFHQFPLISPISNLIITPLVCFIILPLGFFAGFIAMLFGMSYLPFSSLIDSVTYLVLKLIKVFSVTPYSSIHVHSPSFTLMLLYFISLAFFLKSRSKWRLLPFAVVVFLYLARPYLPGDNSLKITFLDVGQGDSSVIELPDKKVMLIDGGTNDPDTGRSVIAPHLWSKGIKRVDYLVLTHPHPDHYGGLIYIMDNFEIGQMWLNGRTIPEAEKFFQKVSEKEILHRVLKRGDVLKADGYKIYVLHPYDEFYADSPRGGFSNQNSDSLVLKIESAGTTALFTGDIEQEAEGDLIRLGMWLKGDIIKVPHHGGRTSSSEEFLRTVNPKAAIVSAGMNNPFNHPHEETLERYSKLGARFLRTDIDGAVTVTLKNKSNENELYPSPIPLPPRPRSAKRGGQGEGARGRVKGVFPYEIKTYQDSRFKKVANWQDEIRNLRLLL